MKAERRHELKTNSLAKRLEGFPAFIKQHANRLMVGLILILLVILALQWRARVNAEATANAETKLAAAQADIANLRAGSFVQPNTGQRMSIAGATTQQAAAARNALGDDANSAVNDILQSQSDPSMLARAQLARGDLYLALSMFPALPGADTQPSLAPQRSSEEYRKLAEDAYQQVLRMPEATDLMRNSARFGLASVAENRGLWDAARKWYNAVADDPDAGPLKLYALGRIENSYTTTQPALLANDLPAESPSTEPATIPADTLPPTFGPPSPFEAGLHNNDVIPSPPSPVPPTQPATRPAAVIHAPPTTQPTARPGS